MWCILVAVYVGIYIDTSVYACMHIYAYVCLYVCTHVYLYVCINEFVYVLIVELLWILNVHIYIQDFATVTMYMGVCVHTRTAYTNINMNIVRLCMCGYGCVLWVWVHVAACATVPDSEYVICAFCLFTCACACVCLWFCVLVHALVCMSVRMHSLRISFASAVYVCFGVYLQLCVCRYVCVFICVCMYVCTYVMYVHQYGFVYACSLLRVHLCREESVVCLDVHLHSTPFCMFVPQCVCEIRHQI